MGTNKVVLFVSKTKGGGSVVFESSLALVEHNNQISDLNALT